MLNVNRVSMGSLMVALALAVVVPIPVLAQSGKADGNGPAKYKGLPEDWSNHHVIFSNPGTQQDAMKRDQYDHWVKIVNDPRYIMQQYRHHSPAQAYVPPFPDLSNPSGFGGNGKPGGNQPPNSGPGNHGNGEGKSSLTRDWSMSDDNTVGTLSITVSSTPRSSTVSSSSTLTIDGQVFTGSAPVDEIGTFTVSAAPSTSSSLTVGTITYDFCTGFGCATTTESANTCTIYEGLIFASRTTTYNDLLGAISAGAAGSAKGTSAWECGTVTGTDTASYTSNNGTSTITMTAVTAGSAGFAESVPAGITFSTSLSGDQAGSDGTDSSTTFKYTTNGAYDTEAQLADDLYTAIGDNTTVTALIAPTYTSGGTSVVLTNLSTTTTYTVSDNAFTALSGTGTLEVSTASITNPNTYPAKYDFDLTGDTPTCSDYVVYPTGFASSATQATIVAYNNIYKTTCSGNVPSVDFAYNTNGSTTGATAGLSPAISMDGSQITYIQVNSSGVASLVILRPVSGEGTPTTPVDPDYTYTCTSGTGSCSTQAGDYVSCKTTYTTKSCALILEFDGGPGDSNSAPFYTYDYGGPSGTLADTIFVGDNSGKLHEFTGVFNGTPAETVTNWPVTVYSNTETHAQATNPAWLTVPVFDSGGSGLIFVNDGAGYMHSVNPSPFTPTVRISLQMECGSPGFVDGPIVDGTNEEVYDFIGYGCSTGDPSYVNEFAAGTSITGITGQHHPNFANTTDTATVQYAGDFDNDYYTNGTGNLYTCVNGMVYQLPITSGALGTTVHTFDGTLASTVSDAATCSPLTEFYNANATGGAADYLFVGLAANGSTVSGTTCTRGCVYNYTIPDNTTTYTGTPSDAIQAAGGAGGIVIDNNGAGTGESQVYFGSQSLETCNGNGATTNSGAGGGTCAVQASQSALQ